MIAGHGAPDPPLHDRGCRTAATVASSGIAVRQRAKRAPAGRQRTASWPRTAKPGNPSKEWDINGSGDPRLQGFATDISVNVGEAVSFKIGTDSAKYRIDIYRLGYYGGAGARLLATADGHNLHCERWRNDPLIVPADFAKLRFWRNTEVAQLKPGDSAVLGYVILGHEWNEDLDNGFRPAGLIRMSKTTVKNVPYIQDYGTVYAAGTATHSLTLYRAPSGALILCSAPARCSGPGDSIRITTPKPAFLLSGRTAATSESAWI
jgi:hypothetical protein